VPRPFRHLLIFFFSLSSFFVSVYSQSTNFRSNPLKTPPLQTRASRPVLGERTSPLFFFPLPGLLPHS